MSIQKAGTVVIVGRMNVGKSTLFNRLAENVKSITLDYAGVTRDFIKDVVGWKDYRFDLIDSGGINLRKTQDPLLKKVQESVIRLLDKADVILFVVDGAVGLVPEDRELSRYLHKTGKPVVVAINKTDTKHAKEHNYEFEQLGHSVIVPISASHGLGINDLLDQIVEKLPKKSSESEKESAYKVVFLGKPNVGKSSLLNSLLQEERSIVSNMPGTTREAVSESIQFYKESIQLTDTPGIRRKRAIDENLETLMVKSAMYALKNSDIVVLLIDGSQSVLVDQELKLAFYAFTEQYKGLILLVNKSDLMTDTHKEDLERHFKQYQHLIKRIPVLYISVKNNKNVGRVLPLVQKVWNRYSQKFENAALTKLFLTNLQEKPLFHKKERLVIYNVKQTETAPITLTMKVNKPDWFGDSQLSFFEKLLRSEYDLEGAPIKFVVTK